MSNPQDHWSSGQRPLNQPFKYVSCYFTPAKRKGETNPLSGPLYCPPPLLYLLPFSHTNILVVNKVIHRFYHHQQHLSQVCIKYSIVFYLSISGYFTNNNFLGPQSFYTLPTLPSLGNGVGHPPPGHTFTIPSISSTSESSQVSNIKKNSVNKKENVLTKFLGC